MSKRPAPNMTEKAIADAQARAERQAAALRENLRRRKEQSRARIEPALAPPPLKPSGE